jgi:hypothetical protein
VPLDGPKEVNRLRSRYLSVAKEKKMGKKERNQGVDDAGFMHCTVYILQLRLNDLYAMCMIWRCLKKVLYMTWQGMLKTWLGSNDDAH